MSRSPIQAMVDQACGFTPEERERVDREKAAEHDAETQRLLACVDAALWWWRMHRPVAWKLHQHRRNPTVNCKTEAEKVLAETCAMLSLAGWPIKNPAAPQSESC